MVILKRGDRSKILHGLRAGGMDELTLFSQLAERFDVPFATIVEISTGKYGQRFNLWSFHYHDPIAGKI